MVEHATFLLLYHLQVHLIVVLKNLSPLFAPLEVLARDALAVLVARDSGLETLAVFLEALALLAIAAFLVSWVFLHN